MPIYIELPVMERVDTLYFIHNPNNDEYLEVMTSSEPYVAQKGKHKGFTVRRHGCKPTTREVIQAWIDKYRADDILMKP